MDKQDVRRLNLKAWVEVHGVPGKEKSYFSQLLGGASFGERAARRLEKTYGMPAGALDQATNEMAAKVEVARSLPAGAKRVVAVSEFDAPPGVVKIRKVTLSLSAGISGFAIERELEDGNPIYFRQSWLENRGYYLDKLIALPVKGDSMEPGLYDGDTVVVNIADTKPKDGEVFAVNYEGEAVIKRLVREIGFWWLVSDNQDQRRFSRKRCEGEACIIIGRVIHKQSERI